MSPAAILILLLAYATQAKNIAYVAHTTQNIACVLHTRQTLFWGVSCDRSIGDIYS